MCKTAVARQLGFNSQTGIYLEELAGDQKHEMTFLCALVHVCMR